MPAKIKCDCCGKDYEVTPFSPLRENEEGHLVCINCEEEG